MSATAMGPVVAGGKSVLFPSVDPQAFLSGFPPHTRELVASLHICSIAMVPLWSRGKIIGVTTVSRTSPTRPLTEHDLQLIEDIAGHASLAIANARLFTRLQAELVERERLAAQLRLLSELSQEFARAAGDQRSLLTLIARRIGEVLGDGCSVLLGREDGTLEQDPDYIYNSDPARLALLRAAVGDLPLRVGEGLSGRVVETGQALFLPYLDLDHVEATAGRRYREIVEQAGIRSIIAVPLRRGAKVIGVCTLYRSSNREAFTDSERSLLDDLASHASLTLTNSMLLEASVASLRTQEVLRRRFLEAAPDAVLIVDSQGLIILVNSQAETMFGYARSELLGTPIEVLVPERYRDHHPHNRARYLDGPRTRPMGAGLNLFAVRKDGTEFAAEISLSPIETPEGMLVAAAIRDVTERRREMEERNRRMQDANRLKSEFLANMSHELRTPLNAVIGFAALMHSGKAGPLADTHMEYLGDILTSSRHLLQLINDVLDLSKVEAGRMELHVEWANVAKLVNEVRDITRGIAAEKSIRITVDLSNEIERVKIDPRLFKQVLYNYLSNALKFTPDAGTVIVRISKHGEDTFRLDVEDTGIGIKLEDIRRLFVEFQQLDQGASKRYPGTGLGLALTKRIVEALGGSVSVASIVGKGSTFTAVLPVEVRSGR